MASVPYSPVPNVAPTVPGLPRVGIETPPAAFGLATAAAVRGLGQQTEQSSNEMFQTALGVQQLRNETWAKDEFVKQSVNLGNLENDFYKLKGADAEAARSQYMQSVQNLYQTAIANAPNPQAARFLGDSLSRRISYSLVDAGRHAAQQQFEALDKSNDDLTAAGWSNIQQHPNNPDAVRQNLDLIRSAAQSKIAHRFGAGSDFSQLAEKNVSEGLAIQYRTIGFDDPQRALAMLDANQNLPDDSPYKMKGVTPQGRSYVEATKEFLQNRNDIVGADADAERILFGGGDLPKLGPDAGPDYLEKALNVAKDLGKPYGAQYTQHLTAQVENKFKQFNTAYRMEEYGTFSGLSGAITGANGGGPITDRNTFLSNPVLYQQYESLGQTARGKDMQRRLMTMIDNIPKRGSLGTDEQRALVDRIRGFGIEAQSDPAARDEFIKMFSENDLYSKVDQGLKSTLSSELEKVRSAWAKMGVMPNQDRAAEAIASLKPMMDSAGIKRDPNNKAANNQYYEFVGALSAKIQAQEALTGKRLGDKEINDIAVPLIQRIGGIGQAIKNNGGVGAPPPNVPQASM